MTLKHLVRTAGQEEFVVPPAYAQISRGFRRWSIVNRESGSVHQEFNICELAPGGAIDTHIHSFEESIYVLEGQLNCETGDGKFTLKVGDYGVIHVAAPHAYSNTGNMRTRWVEMLAPQPRVGGDGDVFPVAPLAHKGDPVPIDARDQIGRAHV